MVNSDETTWAEFAKRIFEYMGKDIRVNEIKTEELNLPAKRPKNSVLVNSKIKAAMRFWADALKKYMKLANYI